MISQSDHEDIRELLGVYALNSVDDDERSRVEEHLEHCGICRAEVDEFHATAAALGSSTHAEIPDVWGSIAKRIGPAPSVVPIAPRLQSWRPQSKRRAGFARIAVSIAASVAALAGAFAAGHASVDTDNPAAEPSIDQLALSAASAPTARTVALTSNLDSSIVAHVVMLPDGHGYVYDSTLPALPEGRTYQLWVVVNETPISAGVLGGTSTAVPFAANGPITAFAITEEAEGGVIRSVHDPLVAGKVST